MISSQPATKNNNNMWKRFVRWLRFNPPPHETMEGWKQFYIKFEKQAPLRYRFDRIRIKIRSYFLQIKSAIWWVRHRTTHRYHTVETGLEPGWYDTDHRMLASWMSLIKDYVEIECAHLYAQLHPGSLTWWERLRVGKTRYSWRNARFGINYLLNIINDPTNDKDEKDLAREVLDIYQWWHNDWDFNTATEVEDEMLIRVLMIRKLLWT